MELAVTADSPGRFQSIVKIRRVMASQFRVFVLTSGVRDGCSVLAAVLYYAVVMDFRAVGF